MLPEETLQAMAIAYPSIFPTRRLALHHLFLTIGNGADWVNGEIVYDDREIANAKFERPVTKAVFEYPDDYALPNVESYKRWCERNDIIPDPKMINPYLCTDYKDKEYLKLYNYPDDITPEWKALLEECKEYVRREGIDPDQEA